jgi:pyoverdine/dityrosine biosynthesis protein Dit1
VFEHIEFREPYGHLTARSKLERYWDDIPLRGALTRKRTLGFDAVSGMSTSPMQYVVDAVQVDESVPSMEWVSKALAEFVRDEFGASPSRELRDVKIQEIQYLESDFLPNFARRGENIRGLIPSVPSAMSDAEMAGLIFDLLADERIGARKNATNNSKSEFIERQSEVIRERGRLLVVLPGFPFKDQNILRVPFGAEYPDLAEVSFMLRLHRLTQIVYQFHPYGADVLVLSDGSVYEDIFEVPTGSSDGYLRRLRFLRQQMNLSGTISFLPLKDLYDVVRERVAHVEDFVRRSISELRRDPTTRATFDSLDSGMKRNLSNAEILGELAFDERVRSMADSGATEESPMVQAAAKELQHRAVHAANEYAVFNLMMRRLGLIERFFPEAIRGTVHPKRGQFGLNGASGGFAWNGVAWGEDIPTKLHNVDSVPFSGLPVTQVRQYLFPDGSPAFFGRVRNA